MSMETIIAPPSPVAEAAPPAPEVLAPATTPAPTPTAPTPEPSETPVSFAEYEALQRELAEKNELIGRIETLAEQQAREAKQQEFESKVGKRMRDAFERASRLQSDDEAAAVLAQEALAIAGEVNDQNQQVIDEYEKSVQQAFWEATAPGFADFLITRHNLPPSTRSKLLTFTNEHDMSHYAEQVAAINSELMQQFSQVQSATQANALRASGAMAVGGEGGNLPPRGLEPGTAEELMPVLRQILGMTPRT